MNRYIKLTLGQIRGLDAAVLFAIRAGVSRCTALLQDVQVASVLGTLPPLHQGGKSDVRYVDGALQRLRRGKRIACKGQKWRAVRVDGSDE